MKVSELGEFGLINLLTEMASKPQGRETAAGQGLILGIGDDAAAWQSDGSVQLATADSLIQDIHFTLDTISWEELGWKALAVNLSDIAAMGGLARYALVSLALPGSTDVANVTALYRGMIELAWEFDVAIVGGDTCQAPLLVINITVLGSTGSQDRQILTRSAARPGDRVAVTGYLGDAAAGLEMLNGKLQFDAEATAALKKAFLQPYPRLAEGRILVDNSVRTAIDISDGLVSDLKHVCQASRVSARIETQLVPVSPAVRENFGDRELGMALSGGEDYELLFTANDDTIDRVKAAISCPVTVIGEIMEGRAGEVSLVDGNGNPVDLPGAGWEHFTQGKGSA